MARKRQSQPQQQVATNQFTALSDLVSRAALAGMFGQQFGGARDMNTILGYLATEPTYEHYRAKYDRQDIAGRIVDAPAMATWRHPPEVVEDEQPDRVTLFETQWQEVVDRLHVYEYLCRADKLAGIGRYSVLLLGVADGKPLEEPLEAGSLNGPDDLLYLAPYSEKSAPIRSYIVNPNDSRFGRPEFYDIDFAGDLKSALPVVQVKQKAHWTRVLHVADGLLEDDIFGTPRLKGIYNLLDDLLKIVGGSAEMYWQGARGGVVANASGPLGTAEKAHIQDELDEFYHGLRRFIRAQNMDIESLTQQIPHPQESFDVVLSLIAGRTGIPKRILTGAEQGELASSQDETNWNARMSEREQTYAEPHILRPFIDRLILAGALQTPGTPYLINWPDRFEMSANESAEVALKKTQALAAYANSAGADLVVPPSEFRRDIMGMLEEPTTEDLASIQEEELEEDDPEVQEQFTSRRAA